MTNNELVTKLFNAIIRGDLAEVKKLHEVENCNPEITDSYCRTPYFYAAEIGKTEIVHYYAETHRCDFNTPITETNSRYAGQTPLFVAARKEQTNVVKLLHETHNYNLLAAMTSGKYKGQTLLYAACKSAQAETVTYLSALGAGDEIESQNENISPCLALIRKMRTDIDKTTCTEPCDSDILKTLITNFFPRLPMPELQRFVLELYQSKEFGSRNLLITLVKETILRIEIKFSIEAIETKQKTLSDHLIELGEQALLNDAIVGAMHDTIKAGNLSGLKHLYDTYGLRSLEEKYNLRRKFLLYSSLPNSDDLLNLAAKHGQVEIAEYLITEQSYSLDDSDDPERGSTALEIAASEGHLAFVKFGCTYQPFIDRDSILDRILEIAAHHGRLDIFEYIHLELKHDLKTANTINYSNLIKIAIIDGRDKFIVNLISDENVAESLIRNPSCIFAGFAVEKKRTEIVATFVARFPPCVTEIFSTLLKEFRDYPETWWPAVNATLRQIQLGHVKISSTNKAQLHNTLMESATAVEYHTLHTQLQQLNTAICNENLSLIKQICDTDPTIINLQILQGEHAGSTPFEMACKKNQDVEIIKYFCENYPFAIGSGTADVCSSTIGAITDRINNAAVNDAVDIVIYLLKLTQQIKQTLMVYPKFSSTILDLFHFAFSSERSALAEALIREFYNEDPEFIIANLMRCYFKDNECWRDSVLAMSHRDDFNPYQCFELTVNGTSYNCSLYELAKKMNDDVLATCVINDNTRLFQLHIDDHSRLLAKILSGRYALPNSVNVYCDNKKIDIANYLYNLLKKITTTNRLMSEKDRLNPASASSLEKLLIIYKKWEHCNKNQANQPTTLQDDHYEFTPREVKTIGALLKNIGNLLERYQRQVPGYTAEPASSLPTIEIRRASSPIAASGLPNSMSWLTPGTRGDAGDQLNPHTKRRTSC